VNERRDELEALLMRQGECNAALTASEQRWLDLRVELEQLIASAQS